MNRDKHKLLEGIRGDYKFTGGALDSPVVGVQGLVQQTEIAYCMSPSTTSEPGETGVEGRPTSTYITPLSRTAEFHPFLRVCGSDDNNNQHRNTNQARHHDFHRFDQVVLQNCDKADKARQCMWVGVCVYANECQSVG